MNKHRQYKVTDPHACIIKTQHHRKRKVGHKKTKKDGFEEELAFSSDWWHFMPPELARIGTSPLPHKYINVAIKIPTKPHFKNLRDKHRYMKWQYRRTMNLLKKRMVVKVDYTKSTCVSPGLMYLLQTL